jgi:NAD(P)-dependent dehydrogenase (short-subunit alcohol dehydrogenase family)
MRLKDKVSLITGAGSGIGAATARTFAREGAAVVVVDLNEAGGNLVVAEIRTAGGTSEFHRTDVG